MGDVNRLRLKKHGKAFERHTPGKREAALEKLKLRPA